MMAGIPCAAVAYQSSRFIKLSTAHSRKLFNQLSSSGHPSTSLAQALPLNSHCYNNLVMATLVRAPEEVVQRLQQKIQADDASLADKYRALFSLRNVEGTEATQALTTGEEADVAASCCGSL
eukprot:GHRQ01029826.1.p1 GENE.GHRQ01029826.1~~GHRQ01029826.1.p1  ORF type:complete len:122 (+),score=9.91 GHRQ01029826.1:56-421(+)